MIKDWKKGRVKERERKKRPATAAPNMKAVMTTKTTATETTAMGTTTCLATTWCQRCNARCTAWSTLTRLRCCMSTSQAPALPSCARRGSSALTRGLRWSATTTGSGWRTPCEFLSISLPLSKFFFKIHLIFLPLASFLHLFCIVNYYSCCLFLAFCFGTFIHSFILFLLFKVNVFKPRLELRWIKSSICISSLPTTHNDQTKPNKANVRHGSSDCRSN